MRRSKGQIMFNFLPGKTFDYEGGQAICKVTRFEANEDTTLNKRYVLDRVAWLLKQWPEERRRGFQDPYRHPNLYVLATPTGVEAEIFPLLYECKNPECRRVVSYRDVRQASGINPNLQCPTCKSPMVQLHHVMIHQCGHIRPLTVPSCPKHGTDHIWLDTRGSQKYAQFRWRCRRCDFEQSIVYVQCDNCDLPEKKMRPIVHRASDSYYPQYITLVNLPSKDLTRILEDPERHWLAIAAYLDLFDRVPGAHLLDMVASPQGQEPGQESIALLEKLIQMAPPATRESLERTLSELQRGMYGLSNDSRNRPIAMAKELVKLQDRALEEAGQELLEFVRINETLQITTLEQLEQKAQQVMAGSLPVYRVAYREALRETGLADVRLIGDFPVTTVIVGFTRDQREADKTVIRAFPRLRKDDPRTPMFVDTVETEALMFRLDPIRVLRWLVLNGLATDNEPDYSDERKARAWILNQMSSINPFQEIPEGQPITRAVYGLIHSFSHLVLRQAVIQSGFDRTSLSEYLFPVSVKLSPPGLVFRFIG